MIQITAKDIEKINRGLQNAYNTTPEVISVALNKGINAAKKEAQQGIIKTYYVDKIPNAKKKIKITRSTLSNLVATLKADYSPTPLVQFRAWPNYPTNKKINYPFRVTVRRDSKGGYLRQAFVTRVGSGHVGVFERVGSSRLPIEQKFGPSMYSMATTDNVGDKVRSKAEKIIFKSIDTQIKKALRKV